MRRFICIMDYRTLQVSEDRKFHFVESFLGKTFVFLDSIRMTILKCFLKCMCNMFVAKWAQRKGVLRLLIFAVWRIPKLRLVGDADGHGRGGLHGDGVPLDRDTRASGGPPLRPRKHRGLFGPVYEGEILWQVVICQMQTYLLTYHPQCTFPIGNHQVQCLRREFVGSCWRRVSVEQRVWSAWPIVPGLSLL